MHAEFKVKEYAAREQVTQRTVRRWIEKGAIQIRRTASGGIRILEPRQSAVVVFDMSSVDISRHSST